MHGHVVSVLNPDIRKPANRITFLQGFLHAWRRKTNVVIKDGRCVETLHEIGITIQDVGDEIVFMNGSENEKPGYPAICPQVNTIFRKTLRQMALKILFYPGWKTDELRTDRLVPTSNLTTTGGLDDFFHGMSGLICRVTLHDQFFLSVERRR